MTFNDDMENAIKRLPKKIMLVVDEFMEEEGLDEDECTNFLMYLGVHILANSMTDLVCRKDLTQELAEEFTVKMDKWLARFSDQIIEIPRNLPENN